jgi:Contractile injection system tube protein
MGLIDTAGKFVLISLETPDSFIFDFFPKEIQGTDRANWEGQDVSIGTKPLFYSSTEPRKISVPELMLDGTRTNQDIGGQIDRLRKLKQETPNGAPPALLAIWGDRQQRCVMEEVMIAETFFTPAGDPLRARVSLQLVELQEEREVVTSTVTPIDAPVGG